MATVGIDWGLSSHCYVILSDSGEIVKKGTLERTVEQMFGFVDSLVQIEEDPADLRVGIDRKRCLLVRTLLGEGISVYALNPKSTDRARDVFRPAGGKDDRTDAFVHAKMVQAGWHPGPLQPEAGLTTKLSALLRRRRRLVKMRTAARQALNAQLADWAPGLYRLCGDLGRRWTRDLLGEFPLDQDPAGAHGNTLNRFVGNHRMGHNTEEAIRGFGDGEHLHHGPEMADFFRAELRSDLELIERLSEQIQEAEGRISELLEQAPEAEVFRSLPAEGDLTVAALVVLFHRAGGPERDWEQHASYAGVAPVTEQSGGHREVHMRRGCDQMLRDGLTSLAHATSQVEDCWASAYYRRKRREGKTHHGALRRLAKQWVKILHCMWHRQTPYSDKYHRRRRRRRGQAA